MKLIRIALLLLVVCMFVYSAAAVYDFDGYDLTTVAHDTINGVVYVGGGHGFEGTPYVPNTYTQNFSVPSGTVRFAKLYVSVWGGKEEYNGTLQTNFNGNDLGTLTLEGEFDINPDVWCTGHGVYWVHYNVTTLTTTGFNTATANTNQINSAFDGRMYGIVLVAVIENAGKTEVEYWINDGHWNLNYQTPFNSATTQFSGTIVDPDNKSTTLTTAYLTGDVLDGDTLQFNTGSVIDDAADGRGIDEWGNSWQGAFDIDEWWDSAINGDFILKADSNAATFDRGGDPYLHPALAVLEVRPDMLGDVNVDGRITVTDAVMVLNHAVNPAYQLACQWAGDVNVDGRITVTDAVMVLNRAVNPTYPFS